MRAYGNWCGGGWTAGQYKDAAELTEEDRLVPAIDALDAACKRHDIMLHDHPELANEINADFVNEVKGMGITGALFALAVSVGGPSPAPVDNLQQTSQAPMPRRSALRRNQEAYERNEEDLNNQYMKLEDRDGKIQREIEAANALASEFKQASEDDENMEIAAELSRGFSKSYETPQLRASTSESISPPLKKRLLSSGQALSLSNSQDSTNMETNTTPMASAMVLRSAGTSSNNQSGSSETPITPAKPHYMYEETETVKAGVDFWFTIIRPQTTTPAHFTLKLNSPNNIFVPSNFAVITTTGSGTSANSFVQCNVNSKLNFDNHDSVLSIYPVSLPAAPVVKVQMWGNYFKKYQYYTVLSCDYKIIMQNASTNVNDPVSILYGFNSSGVSSVGTKFPLASSYWLAKQWKGITEVILPSSPNPDSSSDNIRTISGHYTPGEHARAVSNDGDVKRWTKLTEAEPTYREELFVMAYRGPFAELGKAAVRCQVQCRYVIQFKEPYLQYRYPYTATAIVETTADAPYSYV